jgi:hypothetical protein
MPWQETDPVDQRRKFVKDLASGLWTMSELCDRYGISRKTGYKLTSSCTASRRRAPRGWTTAAVRRTTAPIARRASSRSSCSRRSRRTRAGGRGSC